MDDFSAFQISNCYHSEGAIAKTFAARDNSYKLYNMSVMAKIHYTDKRRKGVWAFLHCVVSNGRHKSDLGLMLDSCIVKWPRWESSRDIRARLIIFVASHILH